MAMPLVLRQVLASEKVFYVSVLFMLPITIFTIMGLMTIEQWRHDALWALSLLVGGKTLQGAAASFAGVRQPPVEPEDEPATAPHKHKKPS